MKKDPKAMSSIEDIDEKLESLQIEARLSNASSTAQEEFKQA